VCVTEIMVTCVYYRSQLHMWLVQRLWYMRVCYRGHGTYLVGEEVRASVAGAVERVNKLILVTPLKSR